MQTSSPHESIPKARLWTGLAISGLVILFFAFDGITKIIQVPAVVKASAGLGLSANTIVPLGVLLLACTVIYLIPRTAVLGAVLLTGYLGGSIAIQVRVGSGAFPVIFSLVFGLLVWAGLVLREPRLARLVALRRW